MRQAITISTATALFVVLWGAALSATAAQAAPLQTGRRAEIGNMLEPGSIRQLQELNFGARNGANDVTQGTTSTTNNPTVTAPNVLSVRSGKELTLAIHKGFQYIEIREHLDLTDLEPVAIQGSSGLAALLGPIPPEVWTIRGNCDTDATPEFLEALNQEVPVMPRTPGMCMLLAPTDVLYHRSGNLWLENLYIRVARNASSVNTALTMLSVSDPAFDTHLWVTNSILQGDGGLKVNGLTVSSKAYVGDTKFMNLGFGEPPISLRLNDSSLALEGCEFSTNEPTDNLGIVTVDGESRTLVKIQNTSFSTDNVGNVTLLGVNGSRWYTDGCAEGNPCDMVVVPPAENGTVQPAQGIQQAPQGDSFLILADPWLQRVREESDTRPRNRFEISSSDGSGTGGLSLAAIVGIACAALVPLIATAGLLLWRWRYIQTTALSEAPESMMCKNPQLTGSMIGSRQQSVRSVHSTRSVRSARSLSSNQPHLRPPPINLMPTVPSNPELQQ